MERIAPHLSACVAQPGAAEPVGHTYSIRIIKQLMGDRNVSLTLDGLDRADARVGAVAQRATCSLYPPLEGEGRPDDAAKAAGWVSFTCSHKRSPTPAHISLR